MISKEAIVKAYLDNLEADNVEGILSLFAEDGKVVSPIYGIQEARSFYLELSKDTRNSTLHFDGLFMEPDSNRMVLVFDYEWTMENANRVTFKVVDIIELNGEHKITKLTIIYDADEARSALKKEA
jgi:ABC-type arginine transport system ATPase subunit